MVSKIAVIALVAVIATPILLGYAFNLSEETVTDYAADGESLNVTPLLQNDIAYNDAQGDVYRLNTDFDRLFDYLPVYESVTTTASPFKMQQSALTIVPGAFITFSFNAYATGLYVYLGPNSNVTFIDLEGGYISHTTVSNIVAFYYDPIANAVQYEYSNGSSFFTPYSTGDLAYFRNDGATNVVAYYSGDATSDNHYVDLAGGFHFENIKANDNVKINLPDKTKSILLTMDLNSITASSYSQILQIGLEQYTITKTTVNSDPKWSITYFDASVGYVTVDLYYDTSRSSNVYQMYYSQEYIGLHVVPGIPGLSPDITYYRHQDSVEMRYVGDWPTIFGAANVYMQFDWSVYKDLSYEPVTSFDSIKMRSTSTMTRSLTMRLDAAVYSAFAYSIISDKSYAPADFKTNPTTTLSVSKSGTSLEFAGSTYAVDSSGNITMGTHKVSVNGMQLSSIPAEGGGYENKINDYVVSTTAQPSTIKFNGNWGASVSTVSNATTTYTKTQWHVGEFGWDGIDQNFLIVGLITCLAVFIGLGIYARKARSGGIIPLMIVTGCAAAVFFIML